MHPLSQPTLVLYAQTLCEHYGRPVSGRPTPLANMSAQGLSSLIHGLTGFLPEEIHSLVGDPLGDSHAGDPPHVPHVPHVVGHMTLEEAVEVIFEARPFVPCSCGFVTTDMNGDTLMMYGHDENHDICSKCCGDGEVVNDRHVLALIVVKKAQMG